MDYTTIAIEAGLPQCFWVPCMRARTHIRTYICLRRENDEESVKHWVMFNNVAFTESLTVTELLKVYGDFNFYLHCTGYKMDEHDRDSAHLRLQFSKFPGARAGSKHRGKR